MKSGRGSRRKRPAVLGVLGMLVTLLLVPASATAGSPAAHASIIGGDVASIDAFPALAYIAAQTGKDEGFACTGTVIAPRVVLTAAHCVEDLDVGGFTPAGDYKVATGR